MHGRHSGARKLGYETNNPSQIIGLLVSATGQMAETRRPSSSLKGNILFLEWKALHAGGPSLTVFIYFWGRIRSSEVKSCTAGRGQWAMGMLVHYHNLLGHSPPASQVSRRVGPASPLVFCLTVHE
jgi:hypothetical protein